MTFKALVAEVGIWGLVGTFFHPEGSKPSSGVAVNQVPAVAAEQRPKAPVAVEEVEVDVETSKSMLRTMLARLEAEEAQWLQLQERLPGLPQAPRCALCQTGPLLAFAGLARCKSGKLKGWGRGRELPESGTQGQV